jgi:hypothetical protein
MLLIWRNASYTRAQVKGRSYNQNIETPSAFSGICKKKSTIEGGFELCVVFRVVDVSHANSRGV